MTKHVWFINAHPDDFNPGLGLALVLRDLAGYTAHAADFNRGERGLIQEGVSMEVCAATRVEEERRVCAGLGIEPVFLPAIDGGFIDASTAKTAAVSPFLSFNIAGFSASSRLLPVPACACFRLSSVLIVDNNPA